MQSSNSCRTQLYHHAIITGGSSGIGLALAQQLNIEGTSLTLIGRDWQRLKNSAEKLFQHNAKIAILSADVRDESAVRKAIDIAIESLGPPDLLVTSAGVAVPGNFMDLDLSTFQDAMATNYFGTLYAVRAVVPIMSDVGSGTIVMIASGAALIGVYGYSAYAPSKYAVRGLGEVLRGELKPLGINVSIVFPPDTNTPQLVQENLIKPSETLAISGKVTAWSADAVASVILNGLRHRRFVIAPGWQMGLLARWHSLLNPILQYIFDYIISRNRISK